MFIFPDSFKIFFSRILLWHAYFPPLRPLVWDLLRFLDLWISVFNQIWKSLGLKFFIYFLGPILSLLSIWDLSDTYVRLFLWFHICWTSSLLMFCSFLLNHFSLCILVWITSIYLCSSSLIFWVCIDQSIVKFTELIFLSFFWAVSCGDLGFPKDPVNLILTDSGLSHTDLIPLNVAQP